MFNMPEKELTEFLNQFIASRSWQFIKDYLEQRFETVMNEKMVLNISPDARAMLDGRLFEIRALLKTPENAALFYRNKQLLQSEESLEEKMNFLRTAFPDIVTH